jgi:zinc protease
MKFRLQALSIALVVVAAAQVMAQSPAAPVPAATAALTAQVPLDPAITRGTLPNGLTYFIRTTKRPEKRGELRLVVNAGSILEQDDQKGLAHFVEHMAFNGTKNFPKQEIPTFLESLGMRFGPSVNAYTSFDETVYMLQVPTEKPEVLDRAFLILEDWAHGVTFDPAEIDKERGVVIEEWRGRRGAGARMQDKQLPIMLKGSRYADRLPIGTVDNLQHFKHERLTSFYRDWYRPDLMSVIAVGDFDPAAVEKMIRAHFAPIPAAKSPLPREMYPVPAHPGTLYAIATDKEATTASVTVYSKMELRDQRTIGAFRQQVAERLFSAMLGARFAELAQKPDAPFVNAGAGRSLFVRTAEVSTLGALVKGDAIDKTLEALFTEAERVARFGFTPGELERPKQNILAALERAVREKDNTPAAAIAGELVRHVTDREPVAGIVYEHELYKRFLPQITLAEVNALAKEWVPDRNRVVTVSAPEKVGFAVPDEKALTSVLASVAGKDIKAYVDTVDNAPLLDPLPSPGAVVKTATKDAFGITEWTLANGVTVVLKPTDFKEDEILFRASSFGGHSLASDADFIPASNAVSAVSAGGVGRFSAIDLPKVMTGKQVNVSASISAYEEGLGGVSSKKDLETMFQLIHLRFTQPRPDPTAFGVLTSRMKSSLANVTSSPAFAFNEALTSALRKDHPRTAPFTVDKVDQMDLDKSLAFYKDRFADASDFTFVFVGSFDPAAMKPLVERYLGSLPSTKRKEMWKDTGIRYATGVIERRVNKGLEPQSRAAIVFSGPFEYNQTERVAIRGLGDVLNVRLRDTLREDLGGTYGVSVSPGYAQIPVGEYALNISFTCAPERTEELMKAALQQIELLKTEGPTEKQVTDAKEKLLRDFETNMKENSYLVTQLSLKYQYTDDIATLFGLADYYRKLTPAAIQEAAKKYLNTQNVVKVMLFPEKKS